MREEMKGKDIIGEIARTKMPDTEQVREFCHQAQAQTTQTAPCLPAKQGFRRLRWSTVAIAAAAMLIFAGAAYAAGAAIYERFFSFADEGIVVKDSFHPGGAVIYELVQPDCPEYIELWEGAIVTFNSFIYISPNAYYTPGVRFGTSHRFSENEAGIINRLIAGKIFIADGSPFPYDLLVQFDSELLTWFRRPIYSFDGDRITESDDDYLFAFDNHGHLLYNVYGEEIGAIWVSIEDGRIINVRLETITQLKAERGYNDTFESAAEILGAELRLPTVHMEGFDPPMFRARGSSASVIFLNASDVPFGRIWIAIEQTSNTPHVRRMAAEALQVEIAGTTVTKVFGERYATYFTWNHDGLVYRLYPPMRRCVVTGQGVFAFTDAQLYEIIESMIR